MSSNGDLTTSRSIPPTISTPHEVEGFSLGGAAGWVAALLSLELKEDAGGVTNPDGSSGECALGLPPMSVPTEEGMTGVGGSGRTGLPFVPNKLGGGGDADRSVLSGLQLLQRLNLEGVLDWSTTPEFPGGFPDDANT